jgi:hypothetical protein
MKETKNKKAKNEKYRIRQKKVGARIFICFRVRLKNVAKTKTKNKTNICYVLASDFLSTEAVLVIAFNFFYLSCIK